MGGVGGGDYVCGNMEGGCVMVWIFRSYIVIGLVFSFCASMTPPEDIEHEYGWGMFVYCLVLFLMIWTWPLVLIRMFWKGN